MTCVAAGRQAHLKRQLSEELEWVQKAAKGQQKKGKARLRRYDDLVEEVTLFGSGLHFYASIQATPSGVHDQCNGPMFV